MNLSRNVIIHFAGKLIPAFASLAIMVGGLRFLGKSEFGKYNLMFSTAMVIVALFSGWIQQSMLRFLTGAGETFSGMANRYLLLGLLSSILAGCVTMLFALFYFETPFFEMMIYSLFAMGFCLLSVKLTLYQAAFRVNLYAITESTFYLAGIVISFILILIFDRRDYAVFFIGMLISLLLILVPSLIMAKRRGRKAPPATETASLFFRRVFGFGFPLTIWLLISNLFNFLDRYIINHYHGYEAVGVYSSVYDFIYKVSGFLCLPVLLAYHPAISRAWNGNKMEESRRLIVKSVKLEMIVLVLVFLFLFILHDWIFDTVFNLQDTTTRKLFIPIAISALLWQMSLLVQKPLEFIWRQKQMIAGIAISITTNLVLNMILIPLYGYTAAAYNTLASTLFYFCWVLAFASKEWKKVRNNPE